MNIPSWKTVSESLLDPISPSGLRENPQVSMAVKAKQCLNTGKPNNVLSIAPYFPVGNSFGDLPPKVFTLVQQPFNETLTAPLKAATSATAPG